MKRIGNFHNKICDIDNLRLADSKARKGKLRSYGVKRHDKNAEHNLLLLQKLLQLCTYKTSEYDIFKIYEPKERDIYRLPYYPDRITHHALMNHLEPIWTSIFVKDTYSCIKGRGIHAAVKKLKTQLRKDIDGTKYCLKIDIQKFYPSIDHTILKEIVCRKIKDKRVLIILYEIIDSTDDGVPIGNYLSQFFANLYLAYFDHWIKENKNVKYYYRYADDIVILYHDKTYLHKLLREIQSYTINKLNIRVKKNWQVFPVESRGIDFLGYVFYHTYTKLRKSIKVKFCKVVVRMFSNIKRTAEQIKQKICSWFGWAKYCDSINLMKTILIHKMRANTVNNYPVTFENRGDHTYYYNYNIVEGVKENEDGTFIPSYDYDQVIIFGEPTYEKTVATVVRDRYTIDNELALVNNYNRFALGVSDNDHKEEYLEYITFVSEVKTKAKIACIANGIVV